MISADDLKNEQSVNLSDQELEGVAGGKKCAKLSFTNDAASWGFLIGECWAW